ncbi:hypothetical protein B7767_03280 [Streptomyces sp. 13-12-16]|jgi:predicted peroxiredoxin|uniref:DsrE family protein n=1 Tax=Streptomyces sp. 13-12-16 TaxID=1570823 RepID=UPI000A1E7F66|nr:DsrE family protein [Streptomyces sp. 13-12-16]OSP44746.1 hypothetical protein B7767_03280 [Streptomyces sp. 13-12-16]
MERNTRTRSTPHLLVESKGPWTDPRGAFMQDACSVVLAGHPVQLLCVQDAVAAAVQDASPHVRALLEAGGELWVDDFSLAQRGMTNVRLEPGAQVVDMARTAARLLEPGVRVVWH